MINLNSTASWFGEDSDGTETIVPRHDSIDVVSVSQLEKDTILVCLDSEYQICFCYMRSFTFHLK